MDNVQIEADFFTGLLPLARELFGLTDEASIVENEEAGRVQGVTTHLYWVLLVLIILIIPFFTSGAVLLRVLFEAGTILSLLLVMVAVTVGKN